MKLDLVLAFTLLAVLLADAAGLAQIAFGPAQPYVLPGWGEGQSVALGDFDGDLDLAVSSTEVQFTSDAPVLMNQCDATFALAVNYRGVADQRSYVLALIRGKLGA